MEGEVVGRLPQRRPEPEEHDEGPSADDLERFGGVTHTCPNCGKEVFDDAETCYHCGEAMMARRSGGPPLWVAVTSVVLLVAFMIFLLFR